MNEYTLVHKEYDEAIIELCQMITASQKETYVIHFLAAFENSKIIRDFVGCLFDAYKIWRPWRGRFILITDELINNSIEHGSQENDINTCIITVGKKKNGKFYISFEVHDTGKGEKKEEGKQYLFSQKETTAKETGEVNMDKRGRGIFGITNKLVDRLTFGESSLGGLFVKVEKSLKDTEYSRKYNEHTVDACCQEKPTDTNNT